MRATHLPRLRDASHVWTCFRVGYLLELCTSLFGNRLCTRGIREAANMHVGNQGFPTRETCRKPKGRESRGRDPIQEGDGRGALINIFGTFPTTG